MQTGEVIVLVGSFAAVQALVAWWLKARLTASINHEYDQRLEASKLERSRKEKAAAVAEFLAEWTHISGSDTKRLNQLLWELTLYLPSHLIHSINSMVTGQSGGKTAQDVLVEVRDHLLDGSDPLGVTDITHFKHPQNTSMQ